MLEKILSLFKNKTEIKFVKCPRCLGKGNVDEKDIERLNRMDFWIEGSCAYCEGIGSVNADILDRVSPDLMALSTDMPVKERQKIRKGNAIAMTKAQNLGKFMEDIVCQIKQKHIKDGMNTQEIFEFMIQSKPKLKNLKNESREDFLKYIQKIIDNIK